MKTMKKSIVFLIAVLLSVFSVANAQTNEDPQRERDIKIAEGIIASIFGSDVPGFKNQNVHGEYVPGYGVHFTVSPGISNIVRLRTPDSGDERFVVEVNKNERTSSDTEREQQIKEKIYEYMKMYAPLIRGVPEEESVRVTYAMTDRGQSIWVFTQDGERNKQNDPGVSVWTTVSNLKQFRNGNISEQEFINRVNTHILSADEKYPDFDVFASILETAMNNANTEYLKIRRPQMDYLPGLGVRYRIQVSARPGFILNEFNFSDGDFEFRLDSLRLNLNESLKSLEESLAPLSQKLDSMFSQDLTGEEHREIREDIQEQRRAVHERQEALGRDAVRSYGGQAQSVDSLDLELEADAIIEELLNVIENYGSTLTSLADDEMLMISLNWSGRSDDLPERTEVRIKKADLLRGEKPDIEEIKRR